jgi:hypothetical protein
MGFIGHAPGGRDGGRRIVFARPCRAWNTLSRVPEENVSPIYIDGLIVTSGMEGVIGPRSSLRTRTSQTKGGRNPAPP